MVQLMLLHPKTPSSPALFKFTSLQFGIAIPTSYLSTSIENGSVLWGCEWSLNPYSPYAGVIAL